MNSGTFKIGQIYTPPWPAVHGVGTVGKGLEAQEGDPLLLFRTTNHMQLPHGFMQYATSVKHELDKSGTIVPQLPGLHIWAKTEGNVRAIKPSILCQYSCSFYTPKHVSEVPLHPFCPLKRFSLDENA